MNASSEIIEKSRSGIPRQRDSIKTNSLNFTKPRNIKFSGHFNLKTLHILGGWLMVATRN